MHICNNRSVLVVDRLDFWQFIYLLLAVLNRAFSATTQQTENIMLQNWESLQVQMLRH